MKRNFMIRVMLKLLKKVYRLQLILLIRLIMLFGLAGPCNVMRSLQFLCA